MRQQAASFKILTRPIIGPLVPVKLGVVNQTKKTAGTNPAG